MRSKQNKELITPKKSTPKISKIQISSNKTKQNTSIKDFLFLPIFEYGLTPMPSLTPLKKQPEFLLSPSPVKKDLFSQLLGSQLKNYSPCANSIFHEQAMIIEEDDDNDVMDDQSIMSNQSLDSEISDTENDCFWEDQNEIKKRKRKSTAQIKILKQQLDGEVNWTKQKITKMAEVTGLSQSQVYKWCWDQKKKSTKHKQSYKRKMIRKDYGQKTDFILQREEQELMLKRRQFEGQNQFMESRTKPKIISVIEESDINTEKKINKKLIFN